MSEKEIQNSKQNPDIGSNPDVSENQPKKLPEKPEAKPGIAKAPKQGAPNNKPTSPAAASQAPTQEKTSTPPKPKSGTHKPSSTSQQKSTPKKSSAANSSTTEPATKETTKTMAPKSIPPKKTARTDMDKSNQTPLMIGVIALLVAIAAAGGSAYNWNQQQKSSSQYQTRIADLDSQVRAQRLSIATLGNVNTSLEQVKTEVAELNSELGKLGSQIGQLGSDVGQLGAQRGRVDMLETNLNQFTSKIETALAQIAGRVNEVSTSSRSDWQIAEVEYFLRLAADSLIIEGHTKTARSLLEAADRLVQEIDDVGLISLRQAIADDLAAIKAIRVPDYQGMALTLNALAKQVDKLRMPLQPKLSESANISKADAPSLKSEKTWLQQFQMKLEELGNKLASLVRIRQINQPVKPLMPPEQQTYLAQNLHLMLEQVQLALLRKNQLLYQQSLDKALGWIQNYYDPKDAASISFLENLTELKAAEIGLELPDISGSLRTFKAFQQQRLELDSDKIQAAQTKLEVNLQ